MRPEGIPRLSPQERIIMELLLRSEMYGLELVEASNQEIKRGSVYVLLDRLEKKGLVESRLEDRSQHASGIARRLYKPSGTGERVMSLLQRWESFGAPQLRGARA